MNKLYDHVYTNDHVCVYTKKTFMAMFESI